MYNIVKQYLGDLINNEINISEIIYGLINIFKEEYKIDIPPEIEQKFKSILGKNPTRSISAQDEHFILALVKDLDSINNMKNCSSETIPLPNNNTNSVATQSKELDFNQKNPLSTKLPKNSSLLPENGNIKLDKTSEHSIPQFDFMSSFDSSELNLPPSTLDKIATNYTFKESNNTQSSNKKTSLNNDSQWAIGAANSGLSRFGSSLKIPQLTPVSRRRTLSSRLDIASKNQDPLSPRNAISRYNSFKPEDELLMNQISPSQIQSIIQERDSLQAEFEKLQAEIEKKASLAISKSKEISLKLQESQSINQKLDESQIYIKKYELKIDRLLAELESSKRQLEHYTNNHTLNTTDILYNELPPQTETKPPPEHSNNLIAKQLELSTNSSNILFDLFSNCLPSEFAFIKSCWMLIEKKSLDSTESVQKILSSNTHHDVASDLESGILRSSFIEILHLYLSSDNKTGTFYSFLLRSKNSKLLEALKPSIAQYKSKIARKNTSSSLDNNIMNVTNFTNVEAESSKNQLNLTSRKKSNLNFESKKQKSTTPDQNLSQANDLNTTRFLFSLLIVGMFLVLFRVLFPSSVSQILTRNLNRDGRPFVQNAREPINDVDLDTNEAQNQLGNSRYSHNLYHSASNQAFQGEAPMYVTYHSRTHFKHGKTLMNYLLNKFKINGWDSDDADYPT
ncbi:hypothetical protein BB561_001008 [Smittium simulii]|uniref:Uncharacterized protein n=1 Tax=Smittium simulii TaxID=133385 RepID=A0A2T9YWM1_9FUNG|nr:hypothetical protein BB561_001008 [Smittium simulii]